MRIDDIMFYAVVSWLVFTCITWVYLTIMAVIGPGLASVLVLLLSFVIVLAIYLRRDKP